MGTWQIIGFPYSSNLYDSSSLNQTILEPKTLDSKPTLMCQDFFGCRTMFLGVPTACPEKPKCPRDGLMLTSQASILYINDKYPHEST